MSFKKTNRTIHKWASIVVTLPLIVILVTGSLLLLKKQLAFVQPPTTKGSDTTPTVLFEQVLAVSQSVTQAEITSWDDIERLDVRPSKGIIKVRSHNGIEIQIDSANATVLQVAKRNSDLIESIHDGTFFGKNGNLWLMLPVAIIFLVITVTGVILFFIPYVRKLKR